MILTIFVEANKNFHSCECHETRKCHELWRQYPTCAGIQDNIQHAQGYSEWNKALSMHILFDNRGFTIPNRRLLNCSFLKQPVLFVFWSVQSKYDHYSIFFKESLFKWDVFISFLFQNLFSLSKTRTTTASFHELMMLVSNIDWFPYAGRRKSWNKFIISLFFMLRKPAGKAEWSK